MTLRKSLAIAAAVASISTNAHAVSSQSFCEIFGSGYSVTTSYNGNQFNDIFNEGDVIRFPSGAAAPVSAVLTQRHGIVGVTVASCGAHSESCDTAEFTVPADGVFNLRIYLAGSGTRDVTVSCTAAGASTAPSAAAPQISTDDRARAVAAGTTAAASVAAVNTAINSALTGSGPTITTQGAFLTTQGKDTAPNAWVALRGRALTGTLKGTGGEFTLGADVALTDRSRLGLFLSASKFDLDYKNTEIQTEALSFGPYIKAEFGDHYSLTGFALVAKPDYRVDNTSYTATRHALGVTVNADYLWQATQVRSFVSLSGFKESHPNAGNLSSHDVLSMTGALGMRATFDAGNALRPYVSLAAEFSRYDDDLTKRTDLISPRFGTGFSWDIGKGTMALDLDGGRLLKNAQDYGLQVKYDIDF